MSKALSALRATCSTLPRPKPSACGERVTHGRRTIRRPASRQRGYQPRVGERAFSFFGWVTRGSSPPVAKVGEGSDPYAWLQHGSEREIKAYLEAENRYCRAALKPVRALERALFRAMNERLVEPAQSDPEKIEQWYYYMRTREGSAFPIYCRSDQPNGGVEEVLLDQDAMAAHLPYLMVPQCKISPCHTMLAYTADTTGDERYTGFVKDLRSGDIICEVPDVTALEWAADGKTILYSEPDAHRRPCRVWRRLLRGPARPELVLEEHDAAFYMDVGLTKDKQWLTISVNSKTSSEVHLLPAADAWAPPHLVQPRQAGLEYYVEHCRGMLVIVTNAHGASDYKIVQSHPPGGAGRVGGMEGWQNLFTPEAGCRIEDIDVFAHHLVVYERTACGQRVRILDVEGGDDLGGKPLAVDVALEGAQGESVVGWRKRNAGGAGQGLVTHSASCGFPHVAMPLPGRGREALRRHQQGHGQGLRVVADALVELPAQVLTEAAFAGDDVGSADVNSVRVGTCIQAGANCDFWGSQVRLTLSSPVTPPTVLDVSLRKGGEGGGAGRRVVTVVQRGRCTGFRAEDFVCRQEWATSHDGARVPLTVMHRKGRASDGSCPALLVVYGGYGQCLDTSFDAGRLAIMERGWAVVLCHVRGGGELGARWHADGKGDRKTNSFLDLAACVEWVQAAGLASAGKMALHTASAGGLVVGAFANRFSGAVAGAIVKVPFVDMANTMADPTQPLTVHEYDEWGRAADPVVEEYLRSYSPYDNVQPPPHRYPALYVTGAYNDTRVAYWEPAKWVARLRACAPSPPETPPLIVLHTSMEGGHFGTGGAGGNFRDFAREIAFLHLALGLPLDTASKWMD